MGIEIRPFDLETDDLVALTALLHRAYAELLEQGLRFTATAQPPEQTRSRIEGGMCYLAVDGDSMIGTATAHENDPDDDVRYYRRPGVATFSQFGVDPQRRGEGIGQALLRACEAWALEAGHREIALDTSEQATHLIALYKKWGFEIVDSHDYRPTDHQPSGVNYLSVVMSKRLALD